MRFGAVAINLKCPLEGPQSVIEPLASQIGFTQPKVQVRQAWFSLLSAKQAGESLLGPAVRQFHGTDQPICPCARCRFYLGTLFGWCRLGYFCGRSGLRLLGLELKNLLQGSSRFRPAIER